MDYGRIVNRSFEIAWKHKFLWLFGMFAYGSAFNIDFEYLFNKEELKSFVPQYDIALEVLLPFIYALVLWILVMIACSFISNIALIDSVNRIERGGEYSFGIGFSAGLDYFWRFVGLNVLFFIAGLLVFGFVVILMVALFAASKVAGVVSLLFFIPLCFFLMFLIGNISSLADRALIVRNTNIVDAIEEAVFLFKENFSKNVIIFLILIGFAIGFGILGFIVWAMFGIPIALMISSMGIETMAAFFLAFLLGMPISWVLGGILGVFFSSVYTIFYFELVEPKDQKQIDQPPDDKPEISNEPLI